MLSGTNASGKSSVLQALVLLHQTMREHEWSTRLMLNGKSIKLGTVLDVVNESQGGKSFEIGLTYKKILYWWTFTGERNELSMDVEKIRINNKTMDCNKLKEEYPDHIAPNYLQKLLPTYYTRASEDFGSHFSSKDRKDDFVIDIQKPLTTGFTYITAERIGPRETYTLEDKQIAYAVGAMGEYAMSLFYLKRDEPILDELTLETESRNTLFHQVTARMQQFFPNCLLAVEKVQNANAVTLRLKTSNETEFHRPINVGFGLTQVLPIVIAALSAQKEDILLIENPEVHLHPAGQALMGQFLAEVASAGVQVILETHSDHILNGIRRFVKSGGISPKDVALHFFRPRSADMEQLVSPQINANGDLDCWPDGFFDQFDKDMNHFAGWD
jgi:predicted ATPase